MTALRGMRSGQAGTQAILAVVLALAIAAIGFSWYRTHSASAMDGGGAARESRVEGLVAAAASMEASVRSALDRTARDVPTDWVVAEAPVAAAVPRSAGISFVLKGVARLGQESVAFVDDRTVGIGETVDGFTLKEIGAESATFTDARGRTFVLNVYDDAR